jgi:uncharacterized membrane protein
MKSAPILLVVALCIVSNVLSLKINNNMIMNKQINNKNDVFNNMKTLLHSKVMKVLPAIVGASLLITNPQDSIAASSGSRSGGSSFRSGGGSSRQSYSRPNTRLNSGSYSPGYSVMPVPVPMYSPFSPFSYGFGFSPFSFIPINGNLLLFGGLAYVAYSLLKNRIGGSDFATGDDDSGSLGSGATVLKLQVALDSDWSQNGNIMNTLSNIAEKKGAISGRVEIASLLSETAIALLRRKDSWNSASIDGEKFNGALKAEPYFQKIAVQERTKFESETSPSMIREDSTLNGRYVSSKPTQAVVSLIVAIRGSSDALRKNLRSTVDLSDCLQLLASEALTDNGENIMAVEVLWTPSQPGTIVTDRELISDYPELIKL